jgi:DNA-binding response OmpR family regulator
MTIDIKNPDFCQELMQDMVRGFLAGGVDYITKPFQVEEVFARVETHLSLRGMQKAPIHRTTLPSWRSSDRDEVHL